MKCSWPMCVSLICCLKISISGRKRWEASDRDGEQKKQRQASGTYINWVISCYKVFNYVLVVVYGWWIGSIGNFVSFKFQIVIRKGDFKKCRYEKKYIVQLLSEWILISLLTNHCILTLTTNKTGVMEDGHT